MPDVVVGEDGVARCWWGAGDRLYRSYHDLEWGRPVADDNRLFEKLCLEGFQSGLSWLTILRKRENFRRAFKSFDVDTVARFNFRTVERLLQDAGIVRNRAKIEATVNNARRCRELRKEFGSVAAYVWGFEPAASGEPAADAAKAMSKDLKRRGWAFVGPTTVLSFMQAMGLVNDHLPGCDARAEVEHFRARFRRPHRTGTSK
jgi:DNA-3-methyladenine glycosylase I